jgi:hypothetical protein
MQLEVLDEFLVTLGSDLAISMDDVGCAEQFDHSDGNEINLVCNNTGCFN